MNDRTPAGFIPLRMAADLYRRRIWGPERQEGQVTTTHVPLPGKNGMSDALIVANQRQDSTIATFLVALRAGDIVAWIFEPADGQRYRILKDEWKDSSWPERHFLSDTIQTFPGDSLSKFEGRTPFVSEESFLRWLDEIHVDLLLIPRWSLPVTLVWIATRNLKLASRSTLNGDSLNKIEIGLSLRKAQIEARGETVNWLSIDLEKVWRDHLAEAMAKRRIGCIATQVERQLLSGELPVYAGVEFPPPDNPGLALTCEINLQSVPLEIAPIDARFQQRWPAWRDLMLEREKVMELWPPHIGLPSETQMPNESVFQPEKDKPNVQIHVQQKPKISHRHPEQRDAAIAYLMQADALPGNSKVDALIVDMKEKTGRSVSRDTMRRALKQLYAKD